MGRNPPQVERAISPGILERPWLNTEIKTVNFFNSDCKDDAIKSVI